MATENEKLSFVFDVILNQWIFYKHIELHMGWMRRPSKILDRQKEYYPCEGRNYEKSTMIQEMVGLECHGCAKNIKAFGINEEMCSIVSKDYYWEEKKLLIILLTISWKTWTTEDPARMGRDVQAMPSIISQCLLFPISSNWITDFKFNFCFIYRIKSYEGDVTQF